MLIERLARSAAVLFSSRTGFLFLGIFWVGFWFSGEFRDMTGYREESLVKIGGYSGEQARLPVHRGRCPIVFRGPRWPVGYRGVELLARRIG